MVANGLETTGDVPILASTFHSPNSHPKILSDFHMLFLRSSFKHSTAKNLQNGYDSLSAVILSKQYPSSPNSFTVLHASSLIGSTFYPSGCRRWTLISENRSAIALVLNDLVILQPAEQLVMMMTKMTLTRTMRNSKKLVEDTMATAAHLVEPERLR